MITAAAARTVSYAETVTRSAVIVCKIATSAVIINGHCEKYAVSRGIATATVVTARTAARIVGIGKIVNAVSAIYRKSVE